MPRRPVGQQDEGYVAGPVSLLVIDFHCDMASERADESLTSGVSLGVKSRSARPASEKLSKFVQTLQHSCEKVSLLLLNLPQ